MKEAIWEERQKYETLIESYKQEENIQLTNPRARKKNESNHMKKDYEEEV